MQIMTALAGAFVLLGATNASARPPRNQGAQLVVDGEAMQRELASANERVRQSCSASATCVVGPR
jgi:hypothetical protein